MVSGGLEIHSGGYPRIFRNYGYPTIQFTGRVHEQISPSIIALGKGLADSEIIIHHLGYDQSREVMESKVKRNYTLLLQHVKEEPLNGYAWFQLGQTLAFMKMYEQSEQTLRFALDLDILPKHLVASAASSIAQMCGSRRNFQEALQWIDKSLEHAPKQINALHLKAYALLHLQRWEESEKTFEEVLKRINLKRSGSPQAGYDVAVDEKTVKEGLAKARRRSIVG
jgi:tetratricopeptide (TPR) repeat protein